MTVRTDLAASVPPLPGNPVPLNMFPPSVRISTWARRRTSAAAVAGIAPHLLIIASSPAGPRDHPSGVLLPRREHHRYDQPHPSVWPRLLPRRRSRRYLSRPTATTPSRWVLLCYGFRCLLTHHLSTLLTWTPSAQLPKLSSVTRHHGVCTPTGLGRNRPSPCATSTCAT